MNSSVASPASSSALSYPVLSTVAGDDLRLVQLTTAGLAPKALVDAGAHHDFISESMVRRLGFPWRDSAWSFLALDDGDVIPCWVRLFALMCAVTGHDEFTYLF